MPLVSRIRIRLVPVSAMYRLPAESRARPLGPLNVATVPGAPSIKVMRPRWFGVVSAIGDPAVRCVVRGVTSTPATPLTVVGTPAGLAQVGQGVPTGN